MQPSGVCLRPKWQLSGRGLTAAVRVHRQQCRPMPEAVRKHSWAALRRNFQSEFPSYWQ